MAKQFFYECVYPCDVGFATTSRRREDWMTDSGMELPTYAIHPIRVQPVHGMRPNRRPFSADYIRTDKPLGKAYTEEVIKNVSRPTSAYGGARVMRQKINKIKFREVDQRDIPADAKLFKNRSPVFRTMNEDELLHFQTMGWEVPKSKQIQTDGWAAAMFDDGTDDVHLPEATERMWRQGASSLSQLKPQKVEVKAEA